MAKIIRASKGSPQELEMLVENRIAELEDGDITSSFVYPDDLEDLENGEYESHVTEPINCSAIVRPVGYKSWGVYLPDGHNHAEKLFESESEDECYDWINDNQKVIWEKEAEVNGSSIEGASGSPQQLQMLVEDRLSDLEGNVGASFVYPEDLIDLENGEYESHATEPINASQFEEGIPGIDFDDEYEETFDERYKPDVDAIVEWLWDHKQAYEDACRYFGVRRIDTSDPSTGEAWQEWDDLASYVDEDSLLDWIEDHPQLAEDFSNEFGPEWIESCTNTANIMAGIDDDIAYAGPIIKAVDDIIWPNLSDRYTCINDVQAQLVPGKIGHNSGLRVTVSFVDDIQEGDLHFAVALKTLKEYCDTPEDAAYWIQNEIEDQWGDELDQLEADFSSADWIV